MLVKITCNPKDVQDTLEYYEAQDLHLIGRRVLNREATELIFETSGKERAFIGDNVETYLEFQDGSVSPLHIRKDRDWAE